MLAPMNSQEGWELLGAKPIGGAQATETATQVISLAAQQLQALLQIQPDALNYVLDILRRRFNEDIVSDTYGRVMMGLDSYLGSDPTMMLAWLAQVQSDPVEQKARLDAVGQHASSEVATFYRTVIGSYGPELEMSLSRSDELPNNWHVISREVYFDKLRNTVLLRLIIEKFNGENVVIEGPPDSILGLIEGIMITTRLVETRDAFSEDKIQSFLKEADALVGLLRPKPKKKARPRVSNAIPQTA